MIGKLRNILIDGWFIGFSSLLLYFIYLILRDGGVVLLEPNKLILYSEFILLLILIILGVIRLIDDIQEDENIRCKT